MMPASSSTDLELVEATRQGDDRAFEQLYARYGKRIRGYVYRLTHNLDRADDLTQEVFISALRRMRQNQAEIAFRPWIYEIARNACIDEYRRSRRAQEVPLEWDGSADYVSPVVSTAPPPEVAVESKQRLEHLRGAFRELSERHHKVIVLRELEGLSYSQIGDELGMSKMVVESTLFRARRRLSEEFEDISSGRRCEYVRRLVSDGIEHPFEGLGRRDQRALSNHLKHCRACRVEARAAGFDQDWAPRRISKVAVLMPAPLLALSRRLWARAAGATRGAHGAALSSAVNAVPYAGSPLSGAGRAAVAAATLLVAVGGGLVAGGTGGNGSGAPHGHVLAATVSAREEIAMVRVHAASAGSAGAAAPTRKLEASTGQGRGARLGAAAVSPSLESGRALTQVSTSGNGVTTVASHGSGGASISTGRPGAGAGSKPGLGGVPTAAPVVAPVSATPPAWGQVDAAVQSATQTLGASAGTFSSLPKVGTGALPRRAAAAAGAG